jgi:hypothetical protein
MTLLAYYGTFCLISLTLFFVIPPQIAALVSYMAGWLVLPVANFPANTITPEFYTIEVIGVALPSQLGLTKAVIIPLMSAIGLLIRAPGLLKLIRFGWFDLVATLFCLWPLTRCISGEEPVLEAAKDAAYISAAWGGSWLVGRLIAASGSGQRNLVQAIAWSGIPMLPVVLYEGIFSPSLYPKIYGSHPFLWDGATRYVGYRPVGFMEHGNQFGIWIAMSALAWFAMAKRSQSERSSYVFIASVTGLAMIVCQSVGAIALYGLGVIWLLLPRRALGFVAAGAAMATTLSLPVARSAWESVAGGKLVAALRATGRGSLGFRVRRDQAALKMIQQAPLTGYGRWDWWRPLGLHPWGLPLLIAGQLGIVAFGLAMILMAGSAIRSIWRGSHSIVPIIAILGLVDAWLNSYIFWPGLVAAGALVNQFGSRPSTNHSASGKRTDGLRTGDVASAPSSTSAG